jgi:hypothetical protein
MKKERRWLKSAIAASKEPQAALPWQRSARRKPASLTFDASAFSAGPTAIAAR